MRIAFVGSVVPPGLAGETPAYSPAGNLFQVNLLDFLSRRPGTEVEAFSHRPAAAYPRDRVLGFGRRRVPPGERLPHLDLLPYLNVRGAKELTMASFLTASLAGWARRTRGAPRALLVYNLFSPLALPVLATARAFRVPAVAVVADLPYDIYGFRGVKGIFERLDFAAQLRSLRRFDGLVVLTRHIAEDHAPCVPWLLMEGGVDPEEIEDAGEPGGASAASAAGERVVMYSGMLNEMNGIPLLLDAFALLPEPEWRLWVYGGGPLQDLVDDAARRDPRILVRHWSTVPRAELRRRQRQATVLVNPRDTRQRANRYTFPSKLMEYLASGTPVVSTAAPGIPAEYLQHLELASPQTAPDLADALRRAALRTAAERRAAGCRAREFVLREKRWDRQAERVAGFVAGIADGGRG